MATLHSTQPVPFIDLTAQFDGLEAEIEATALRVLRGTDFILGPDVAHFEEEFATYCGAGHAVGIDSGTSALELALRALGVGPGDEVITAANTFIATALAISYTGAVPVLVDVDPRTFTLDVERLEAAITDRTRAIIPVHLYGQPADMDPIMALANRRGLVVVEDACQAHGALYKGRRVGSIGHAAAFSFYPAKNLGAYGDGGMVVTNDAGLDAAMRLLRNYGQREKYHHLELGFNRRLDTLQAALLRVKLRHLDSWNEVRRRHAAHYGRLLDGAVTTPWVEEWATPVWHLYVIHVAGREALRAALAEHDIGTGIHYPVPIHLQPAYRALGHRPGDFPVTEGSARQCLSLPMYPEMAPAQIERVAEAVIDLVGTDGLATTASPVIH